MTGVLKNIIGANTGDKSNMLGKFLYFSLSNILVDKDELVELCDNLSMPYAGAKRLSVSDAFRSATGDIRDRHIVNKYGEQKIFVVYCRDNESREGIMSRELVKETLNERTNQYEKLANISFDRRDMLFSYDGVSYDEDVDAYDYCHKAEKLFELYQQCANRKQIETICVNFLRSIEATKVSGNGHLYFVPRHTMEKVDAFETFIEELNALNRNSDNVLTVNSFYIIDDAKQRDKMTEEFYSAVKKEIAEYQERADYLIRSGSNSPSIMERWVIKIKNLEEKKRHYEAVLQRELDGLDDEFENLKFLSQELSIRANGARLRKAA